MQKQNDLSSASDLLLLEMMRTGDNDATRELFQRYARDLEAGARRFIASLNRPPNLEDAKEAIGNAIVDSLVSLKNVDTYNPTMGPIFPYLLVSVRNRLVDYYRSQHRARDTMPIHDLPPEMIASDAVGGGDTSLAEVALANALQSLPTDQRRIVLMRYVYGYRAGEIAEKLGISSQKVSELLYDARIHLKRAIEKALKDSK